MGAEVEYKHHKAYDKLYDNALNTLKKDFAKCKNSRGFYIKYQLNRSQEIERQQRHIQSRNITPSLASRSNRINNLVSNTRSVEDIQGKLSA